MKIAVVGTGYVGLVSGTCFSEMGIDVTCVDVNQAKIEALLQGEVPFYEPGLKEMIQRNTAAGRLHFTTSLADCLEESEMVFVAVGTPEDKDGSADMRYVTEVAREFGRQVNRHTILVIKSTVPVGTSQRVKEIVADEIRRRNVAVTFEVASNPEFLKEGSAVKDFMSPDRVIVGVESEYAKGLMTQLYRPFLINNFRVIFMDIPSAEMTKYAANAMLATRISFMNDIANLCELVGADVNQVRKGIGADVRIGSKFLYAGCGYGGSCFPKDVRALMHTGEQFGHPMQLLQAVDAINERQKTILFEKLNRYYRGDLAGKTVTLWGLSYKPETDDMREAPSLVLIEQLLAAGCKVKVYDPIAMQECCRRIGERVYYGVDMYDAAVDSDALLLVTEWKQFRVPSWTTLRRIMRTPLLLDGRNIYDEAETTANGFNYQKIG